LHEHEWPYLSQMPKSVAIPFCLNVFQPVRFSLSALQGAIAFQNDYRSDIWLWHNGRAGHLACSLVLRRDLGMVYPDVYNLSCSLCSAGCFCVTFHVLEDRYVDSQRRCSIAGGINNKIISNRTGTRQSETRDPVSYDTGFFEGLLTNQSYPLASSSKASSLPPDFTIRPSTRT
jgi:hypothetical protein